MRSLPAILAAVLLLPSCATRAERVEEAVDVGTHRLHAVVAGQGRPVVVIDGGIGSGAEAYRSLQQRVAERTTVVAYDRAGYGRSEAGPLPRDTVTEVAELRRLLAGLELDGPFVLVGHSLGGLNATVYAARHPDELAGLVLLDPPPLAWLEGEGYPELRQMAERMTDEWQQAADRGLDSEEPRRREEAVFLQMIASEHRAMLGTSARLAAQVESLGPLPLVVIASGLANPGFGADAAGYQKFWVEQSRLLASISSRGRFVLAEDSSHQLHVDAEDLVVESVVSLVEQVRSARPEPPRQN